MKSADQIMAEQATGCCEQQEKGGQFYDKSGTKISDSSARKLFRKGERIEAPNAGAGSYKAILKRLGFHKVTVEDWTSSAGDWAFNIQGHRTVFQSNRYPRCGFSYSLSIH